VPTSGAKRSSASAVEPLNPLSVPSGKLPSVALQEALRGFFQRIDRARQRALASRGSEEEGYEEPARLKFSGAAAFYVGSTGRGLRVQFEPGNESPAGAFITGMVLRVADLLTRVDLSRVKRCPECKRLFLAVRHQRFDTRNVASVIGCDGSAPTGQGRRAVAGPEGERCRLFGFQRAQRGSCSVRTIHVSGTTLIRMATTEF